MSEQHHTSDCAIYHEPAFPAGECDCGGLDLAKYRPEDFRITSITGPGRLGFFVDHMGGECFVEDHQLPTSTLIGIAAAANLIDAHGFIVCGGDANGVNFDDAREAVISKLKAFASSQSFASDIPVHPIPLSEMTAGEIMALERGGVEP